MWQRWNGTTNIFEKSTDNGATWAALPLDGAIITVGTVVDARLSSNIPLKNGANTFTANQLISKTRPEIQFLHSGTAKAHVIQRIANVVDLTTNLSYDGANWNLDDISLTGLLLEISSSGLSFYGATAGANPRTLTQLFGVDSIGQIITNGLISFPATQNPSAGANVLDDYEEGTWTPVLTPAAGSGITYSQQAGTYVKIGKFVFCTMVLTVSALGTASGNVSITGLPFTCGAALGEYVSGVVGYYAALTTSVYMIPWLLTAGTAIISLNKVTASSVANATPQLAVSDLTAASQFIFSFCYRANA